MKRNSRLLAQRGFTLVELLVGLLLVALVLALATPAMGSVTARYQMRSAVHQLHAAMEMARIEAIIRGEPVELCPRAPEPGQCGEDYRNGWIVRAGDVDVPELLRASGPLPEGFAVTNRLATRTLSEPVRWRADGSAGRNLTLQLCAPGASGTDAYAVVVSGAGRSRVAHGEGLCPGDQT